MTEKSIRRIGIAPNVAERDGRAVRRSGAVFRPRARPEHCPREHGSQFFIQSALPRSRLARAATGGDHRAGVGDCRSPPSSLGSSREPLSPYRTARRHQQRPQHHPDRFCRVRLDVSRRRPDRDEASRGNRVRQRDGGDECERPVWPTRLCCGIVGHADPRLGDGVAKVLEAQITAGDGRFRGIRHSVARDDSDALPKGRTNPTEGQMLDPTWRVCRHSTSPSSPGFTTRSSPNSPISPGPSRRPRLSSTTSAGRSGSGPTRRGKARPSLSGRPASLRSRSPPTRSSSPAGSACRWACSTSIRARNRPLRQTGGRLPPLHRNLHRGIRRGSLDVREQLPAGRGQLELPDLVECVQTARGRILAI
jgi:hypothetical protein